MQLQNRLRSILQNYYCISGGFVFTEAIKHGRTLVLAKRMLRFNIWLRETDTSKKKGQFTCMEIQLSSRTKYSFITSKTDKN